jgi:succinate dehydrogenase / fumarate reductase cytochrome b subunit
MLKQYITSSIGRKQIVALTGLLLVGFIAFHLSANLLIFAGPAAYNAFPELMHANKGLLRLAEAGLAAIFITHILFTISVVKENKRARKSYNVSKDVRKRSLATRLMPYTGAILLVFLIIHIMDFTLVGPDTDGSIVNGQHLGIYGLVWNSFLDPFKSAFYIVAMFSVGFHLAHGIQSVFQTFGYHNETITPLIQKASTAIGVAVALLFSSVPVYVLYTASTQVG